MSNVTRTQTGANSRAAAWWLFAKLASRTILAGGLIVAAGWFPAARWAGGVEALLQAVAAVVLAALVSWGPALAWLSAGPRMFPVAVMASLFVRFFATVGLALVLWLGGWAEEALFAWVGGAQLVVLAVDVFGLIELGQQVAREQQA